MTSNCRTAHRVRQWSSGAGLAATAAAMIGMGIAHADVTPLGDAEAGGGALTIAESLGGNAIPAPYESVLEGQLTVEQNALDALSST